MKTEEVVHIDLVSDEEPISKCLAPSIAKRLKSRRGKIVSFEGTPSMSPLKKAAVVEIIEAAGLMKTVTKFGLCYESLFREFSGNTPKTCDGIKECRRLFDRGKRWKIT